MNTLAEPGRKEIHHSKSQYTIWAFLCWAFSWGFLKTTAFAVVESGMKLKRKKIKRVGSWHYFKGFIENCSRLIYSANCGPLNRNTSIHRKFSECQLFIHYHSFLVCILSLLYVSKSYLNSLLSTTLASFGPIFFVRFPDSLVRRFWNHVISKNNCYKRW